MKKSYSASFKVRIVQEVLKCEKSIAQIAAENGVHPNAIGNWKAIALKGLPSLFENNQPAIAAEREAHAQQLRDLYVEIGRLTTQLAFVKKSSDGRSGSGNGSVRE